MIPSTDIKFCLMAFRLAVTSLFMLFNLPVYAQEIGSDTTKVTSEKLLDMPFEDLVNVRVITASLNLQKSGQAPATVVVVTMDQIKLRGYRNLAEVLNDLPDFTIRDKSDPQFYNVVGARGLNRQDLFIILLDGVRISSPTNEPLPMLENFPIYLARQIEVVYGPGSALYGADAMAGVINIITQKPNESKPVNVNVTGGSQGYRSISGLFNKVLKNGFNISMGGQYAYDEQPDFSKVYKSDYDITSYKTGIFNTAYGVVAPGQPVSPRFEAPTQSYNIYASLQKEGLTMRLLRHYTQVPSSTTLKPDNGIYNKDVFYGQEVTMVNAYYSTAVGRWSSTSSLTGSFYKVNPKSNFRNVYGEMTHGYKYSTGSMIKVEEKLNYQPSRKVNLVGGITYELFQSVPKTPELQSPVDMQGAIGGVLLNLSTPNNPSGVKFDFFSLLYRNIGSYLQGQYEPVENLSFTLGVRYDNNSRFGSTINPRVGAVFVPFTNTTVKALYGTAYWAPSPMVSFESYGSFYTTDEGKTYRSDYWHLPNPGLKPMTSQTAELSLQQKVSRYLSIMAVAYQSKIENMITSVSDNGYTDLYNNRFLGWDVSFVEVPFNKGSQSNYGGSISANSTFRAGKANFNAWSSVSYVAGEMSVTESSGRLQKSEQPALTPWQWRTGLDGKLQALVFSVRWLHAGRQRMAAFVDNDNPYMRSTIGGYSLVNVSAGYTVGKSATLYVNVQNALNQRYRNAVVWDASDVNYPTFSSSFQNPLRVMAGVRISL